MKRFHFTRLFERHDFFQYNIISCLQEIEITDPPGFSRIVPDNIGGIKVETRRSKDGLLF